MDTSSIALEGCRITEISREADGSVRIRFEPAYIIRTMTGSVERTRWWQNGDLLFAEAEIDAWPEASTPLDCVGGEVRDNLYTYRNMVPIPLESHGSIGARLRFAQADARLELTAAGVRLLLDDVPKYIEHIRPNSQA